MFVWIRVADYGRVAVVAETRHGGNWASSGSLTAGTITTGTTLFNTADDPTSEMHIGKLYAHDHINVIDNKQIKAGTGGDLQLYHDGTDSIIKNTNGHLYISTSADDKDAILQSDNGSGGLTTYMALDGSQQMAHQLK